MIRWEYEAVYLKQEVNADPFEALGEHGDGGWELISVFEKHGHFLCILKRPKPEEDEKVEDQPTEDPAA